MTENAGQLVCQSQRGARGEHGANGGEQGRLFPPVSSRQSAVAAKRKTLHFIVHDVLVAEQDNKDGGRQSRKWAKPDRPRDK